MSSEPPTDSSLKTILAEIEALLKVGAKALEEGQHQEVVNTIGTLVQNELYVRRMIVKQGKQVTPELREVHGHYRDGRQSFLTSLISIICQKYQVAVQNARNGQTERGINIYQSSKKLLSWYRTEVMRGVRSEPDDEWRAWVEEELETIFQMAFEEEVAALQQLITIEVVRVRS